MLSQLKNAPACQSWSSKSIHLKALFSFVYPTLLNICLRITKPWVFCSCTTVQQNLSLTPMLKTWTVYKLLRLLKDGVAWELFTFAVCTLGCKLWSRGAKSRQYFFEERHGWFPLQYSSERLTTRKKRGLSIRQHSLLWVAQHACSCVKMHGNDVRCWHKYYVLVKRMGDNWNSETRRLECSSVPFNAHLASNGTHCTLHLY